MNNFSNPIKGITALVLGGSAVALFTIQEELKDLLPIIINAILAIVSIGYWLSSKRESASKVANMTAQTEKTRIDAEGVLRNQIGEVIEKNVELFEKLEAEREEKEKAINRISKDINDLRQDRIRLDDSLSQANKRIMVLDDEKEKYRKAYDDSVVKQVELERRLGELDSQNIKNSGEIAVLKKQTDKLHLPARD